MTSIAFENGWQIAPLCGAMRHASVPVLLAP
jgi:hypothetical protein